MFVQSSVEEMSTDDLVYHRSLLYEQEIKSFFAGHKYSRYMNVMNSVYGMDTRGGGLFALFWRSLGEFETIGKTFTNMNLFGTFVYLFAYLHPAAPLALILRMPLNNKRKFSFCCCC